MSASSNTQNKPVEVISGPGLLTTSSDMWDYVQYNVTLDEVYLRDWFEKQIMKGAIERAELEHKIAKLEARLEALERKT